MHWCCLFVSTKYQRKIKIKRDNFKKNISHILNINPIQIFSKNLLSIDKCEKYLKHHANIFAMWKPSIRTSAIAHQAATNFLTFIKHQASFMAIYAVLATENII